MRKIDKTRILATVYQQWLNQLTREGKEHPPYTSSHGKYYYDIIANLILIQEGLCAYTEKRLQDHIPFEAANWQDGCFPQCEFAGHLDHYDNTLKEKYGWLWDNLFVIDADVNTKRKRSNRPNGILKPDRPDFNPFELLEYDVDKHIFIPNRELEVSFQKLVLDDIFKLGLNYKPIADLRRYYLSPFMESVRFGQTTYNESHRKLYQFLTAFEMSKSYMEE